MSDQKIRPMELLSIPEGGSVAAGQQVLLRLQLRSTSSEQIIDVTFPTARYQQLLAQLTTVVAVAQADASAAAGTQNIGSMHMGTAVPMHSFGTGVTETGEFLILCRMQDGTELHLRLDRDTLSALQTEIAAGLQALERISPSVFDRSKQN